MKIRAIGVVNAKGVPCSLCGACDHVIYEVGPKATVYFQGGEGPKEDFLPEGFCLK
jgi:hypothetical protein